MKALVFVSSLNMWVVNKLAVVSIVVFASSVTCQLQTRVVGGAPTTISQYPIVAQLLLDSWSTKEFLQHCAGVILTSRHVISTAHCFQYNMNSGKNYTNPMYWRIRVGSSFRSRGGAIHSIKTIVAHPGFDRLYYTSDVSVVVVKRKFVFGPGVAQGTIAKSGSEIKKDSLCTLVGWGSMQSAGPQTEQLQHTTMYSIDQDICRTRYSTLGAIIADSMLCAGKLDVGGSDGCFGDSGGPIFYKGVVVGLVSFGFECGDAYYPGVYTKISHFTDWIVQTIAYVK